MKKKRLSLVTTNISSSIKLKIQDLFYMNKRDWPYSYKHCTGIRNTGYKIWLFFHQICSKPKKSAFFVYVLLNVNQTLNEIQEPKS